MTSEAIATVGSTHHSEILNRMPGTLIQRGSMPRMRTAMRVTSSSTCAVDGRSPRSGACALRLNNALDRDYADRADFAFGNYRYENPEPGGDAHER